MRPQRLQFSVSAGSKQEQRRSCLLRQQPGVVEQFLCVGLRGLGVLLAREHPRQLPDPLRLVQQLDVAGGESCGGGAVGAPD